jgi:hypothetical protein
MKLFKLSPWSAVLVALTAACSLLAQPGVGLGRYPQAFTGDFGFGSGLLHGAITGAPFSATETTQTQRALSNGTQIQNQQQSTVYRDSQGRVRIDTTVTRPAATSGVPATTQTISTIYDPVAGYTYRLNPTTMTAAQSPIRRQRAPSSGGPPTRTLPTGVQVQTQNLGTATINGVAANGTEVTATIPAGTIGNAAAIQTVRVTWVSVSLQVPVQVTVSDPRFGNASMNLANIVQAAPDESLFQVPAGYTITEGSTRRANRPGTH